MTRRNTKVKPKVTLPIEVEVEVLAIKSRFKKITKIWRDSYQFQGEISFQFVCLT